MDPEFNTACLKIHKVLLSLLATLLFLQIGHSQRNLEINNFKELNGGVAFLEDFDFVVPGVSFLWGKTYIDDKNRILELEAGVALPSIITGKIGVGKRIKKSQVILGLRPFPFYIYLQTSFLHKSKGYWIFSVEGNPISQNSDLNVFDSLGILTIGYRWNSKNRG